jgi:hypothetical protein
MSLVSAAGIIGGIREYTYRGIQQLPIVLVSTSLIYTIATGSIAHLNIVFGMGILAPLYTMVVQTLIKAIMPSSHLWWRRAGSDTCNLVPSRSQELKLYDDKSISSDAIPSNWLTSLAFFMGYTISNAVDCLLAPADAKADEINHYKRNAQATIVLVTLSVFFILILGFRLYYMSGCEGSSGAGIIASIVIASGAGYGGKLMYDFSKVCGARSSDLFGILSQMLPPASLAPRPVVCTSS